MIGVDIPKELMYYELKKLLVSDYTIGIIPYYKMSLQSDGFGFDWSSIFENWTPPTAEEIEAYNSMNNIWCSIDKKIGDFLHEFYFFYCEYDEDIYLTYEVDYGYVEVHEEHEFKDMTGVLKFIKSKI